MKSISNMPQLSTGRVSAKLPRLDRMSLATVFKLVLVATIQLVSATATGVAQVPPSGSVVAAPVDFSANPFLLAANAADAALNCIAIVSSDRLCAVGDCGAILLSENGGVSWTEIPNPTKSNLHSVVFFDSENGLAAGGSIGNYTRTSRAVLLRTSDGGQSWQPIENNLPRLCGMQLQGQRLIAWGDYSPGVQTGVFQSTDLGNSWQPIPFTLGHVRALGAAANYSVVATDTLGRAQVGNGMGGAVREVHTQLGAMRQLHHTGQFWIAVGQNGELARSHDGQTWKQIDYPVALAARAFCAWESVAQFGNEVWIAGNPGSIMLHSSDGGVSWQVEKTGQNLPVHSVGFLDSHRGWAVGALGQIMATRDGGKTWYAQRRANQRAGVMSISNATQVPWAPLVAASWDELVSAVALQIDGGDLVDQADFLPSVEAQIEDISPRLGVQRQMMPVLRTTANSETGAASVDRAQRLAIALRVWRPDVAIVGAQDVASEEHQESKVWITAATSALAMASSGEDAFGQMVSTELALNPWTVDKLVTVTKSESAQYKELSARLLRSVGLSIWDVLLALPPDVAKHASLTPLRTVWSRTPNRAATASLMGGIATNEHAARGIRAQEIGNLQLVMGRVHRRKSIEQLVDYSGPDEKWRDDFLFVIRNLPSQEVQPSLWELSFRLGGNFSRQEIVLQTLATQPTISDASTWAMLQLLKIKSSDEVQAWRELDWQDELPKELHEEGAVQVSIADNGDAVASMLNPLEQTDGFAAVSPFAQAEGGPESEGVVTASITDSVAKVQRDPLEWLQLYNRFTQLDASLVARPDLQLAAYRISKQLPHDELGGSGHLESLLGLRQLVGWPQIAFQELQFELYQTQRLKWTAQANRAFQRPRLDGQLTESCWSNASPIELTSFGVDERPAKVRWAYDQRYLYIGIECGKPSGASALPVQRIRNYDSNISEQDHVHIMLDTDRDYLSAIELGVAEDGRTFDRCAGMSTFNPKWHVSVDSQADRWTAEVAVELAHLTRRENIAGDAWAISARRLSPVGEPQSWSQLKTHEPRMNGSGLLMFVPTQDAP